LCFHQLYDTECPAVDVLNNKTLFYTYRYSIVAVIAINAVIDIKCCSLQLANRVAYTAGAAG